MNSFFRNIEQVFHSELFLEEYTECYDSISDAENRKRGINPMNEEYISKMAKKRKDIGVSKLAENGMPIDNSSEIYIRKIIFGYISKKIEAEKFIKKEKLNISAFLKKQDKKSK